MKFYVQPGVSMIAQPRFEEPSHLRVEWVGDDATDGERLVEYAGRLCYMSFHNPAHRTTGEYIGNLLVQGHGSVLEHANYTLLIEGVSRTLTHELVRHRAGFAYCLAGDTEVWSGATEYNKYNGKKKSWTMRQLFEWSRDPQRKGRLKLIHLRVFDGRRFVKGRIAGIAESGMKPILRMTLEDGKYIRCSADHRFLTAAGEWRTVRQLEVGMRVATNGVTAAGRQRLREQKLGPRNPQWKGTQASAAAGRQRAQRLFPLDGQSCAVCGSEQQLHRHHRDGNTHNNAPENIGYLCATCHQEEHHLGRSMTAKYLQIIAIDPDGFEMTYDLEVAGPHPNFVANGFVTHNSQLSQRYVSAEETAFVIPPAILEDEYAIQVLKNQCEDALLRYRALVDHIGQDTEKKRKQVREAARAVLPNCTETKIVVTGNVRAWRTFIEARATAAADAEMCRLANYVLQILQEAAPEFFQDMEWVETDGRRHVHVLHRKV